MTSIQLRHRFLGHPVYGRPGLNYKTEWVEFPDIEALYKKHNIRPTFTSITNGSGAPRYSVPVIYDPSTDRYVNDSTAIAEYLDKTYPEPRLFPGDTLALQSIVEDVYIPNILPSIPLTMGATLANLAPRSQEFYRQKKLTAVVVPIGEDTLTQWSKFRDGLGKVESWYSKTDGPFLMGDIVSWGDFVIASLLMWIRTVWGKESREWKDIATWHGGRWQNLLDALSKYETVL